MVLLYSSYELRVITLKLFKVLTWTRNSKTRLDFVKLTQNSKDFITLKLESTRVNSSFNELSNVIYRYINEAK